MRIELTKRNHRYLQICIDCFRTIRKSSETNDSNTIDNQQHYFTHCFSFWPNPTRNTQKKRRLNEEKEEKKRSKDVTNQI